MKTRKQILSELDELKEELDELEHLEWTDVVTGSWVDSKLARTRLYQDIRDKEIWIKAYESIIYNVPRVKDKRKSPNLNKEMEKV